MFKALITIFSGIASWLIGLLPAGPSIPNAAGDLIRGGVAFFKSLYLILPVELEGKVIIIMLSWFVAKIAFRGMVWVYQRIRGG